MTNSREEDERASPSLWSKNVSIAEAKDGRSISSSSSFLLLTNRCYVGRKRVVRAKAETKIIGSISDRQPRAGCDDDNSSKRFFAGVSKKKRIVQLLFKISKKVPDWRNFLADDITTFSYRAIKVLQRKSADFCPPPASGGTLAVSS